jgi:hypothetical protein
MTEPSEKPVFSARAANKKAGRMSKRDHPISSRIPSSLRERIQKILEHDRMLLRMADFFEDAISRHVVAYNKQRNANWTGCYAQRDFLIGGRIPSELHKQMKEILERDRYKINQADFIETALLRQVERYEVGLNSKDLAPDGILLPGERAPSRSYAPHDRPLAIKPMPTSASKSAAAKGPKETRESEPNFTELYD